MVIFSNVDTAYLGLNRRNSILFFLLQEQSDCPDLHDGDERYRSYWASYSNQTSSNGPPNFVCNLFELGLWHLRVVPPFRIADTVF